MEEPIDTAFIRPHLARFVDYMACFGGLETGVGNKPLPKRGQEGVERAHKTSHDKGALS